MKYLGSPDAALVTMWVAARHLSAHGSASEDELMAALRPHPWATGQGIALANSLAVGTDLGFFEQTEAATPELRLSDRLSAVGSWFDEFDGFAAIARSLLIQQATRPGSDRSDVADGVAWLLSRDWRRPQDPLTADQSPSEIIVTSTQSGAFARWARDLGFGTEFRRAGLMPDPTAAIRRDIQPLRGQRVGARDFVRHLAVTIPTGPAHPLVPPRRTHEDQPEELEVFSCVGFALKRVEAEGLLKLGVADDAPARLLFRFPGPTDQFTSATHLEVAE